MRSTRRLLLAAILSTSATVFASAQPAGAPPAKTASLSETTAETSATDPRASLIVGEWILVGLLLVAVAGAANLVRDRGTRPRNTVADIQAPDPDPTSLR